MTLTQLSALSRNVRYMLDSAKDEGIGSSYPSREATGAGQAAKRAPVPSDCERCREPMRSPSTAVSVRLRHGHNNNSGCTGQKHKVLVRRQRHCKVGLVREEFGGRIPHVVRHSNL